MELAVVWVIVGLVSTYSLFSYFSAKGWLVTSHVRNDLVFEHRNKAYGAYALRKNYNKRLTLIMGSMVLAFVLGALTMFIIRNLPKQEVEAPKGSDKTWTVQPPPKDLPPPPPTTPPPPPLEKMTAFIPPVIEDDPVTDPVPTQDQLEDTKAGDKTQDGSDENFDPPQPTDDTPKQIDTKPEPIETFVEEEADFPGGFAEMAKFINENIDYPQEAIDLGIKGRVTVRFVVEKDGRISNVSVATPLPGCKACDKAAVKVVEKMPSWKAGKNGGREVRTWVTLPVKFEVN
ncbi:MAG: energy transducer TonB [Crocinitomicaceae bacterium]|nr:energy transducer TonB [Crocinitomicaceae bacterium]